MADKLGAVIAFKDGDETLTATKNGKTITLSVVQINDSEFVSARDLLVGFGYDVAWNGLSKSISIN